MTRFPVLTLDQHPNALQHDTHTYSIIRRPRTRQRTIQMAVHQYRMLLPLLRTVRQPNDNIAEVHIRLVKPFVHHIESMGPAAFLTPDFTFECTPWGGTDEGVTLGFDKGDFINKPRIAKCMLASANGAITNIFREVFCVPQDSGFGNLGEMRRWIISTKLN